MEPKYGDMKGDGNVVITSLESHIYHSSRGKKEGEEREGIMRKKKRDSEVKKTCHIYS